MKNRFRLIVALCLGTILFGGWDSRAMVVERGKCGIVVAEDAVDATRFAARELQNLLGPVLGEEPSVVNAPLGTGVSIVLGENRWSREAGLDASALPRDGFIIRVEPERIFICGRDDGKERLSRLVEEDNCGKDGQHATLFGVYAFLERYANCRFFFPGEMGTVLPRQDRLEIPLGEISKGPYFTSRSYYKQGDGAWYEPRSRKALNWLRLRMETYNPPCCHGQNKFMPLERFATTHPEYFQLRKDGTRCTNVIRGVHFDYYLMKQLCHTSGVWDEFYKDAVSYLRGEDARVRGIPSAAVKGAFGWNGNCYDRKYIDMMPQDGMSACECPSCQAAYLKDERQYARELIWGNTARFARRLKADGFKDAVVTQMAYGAYRGVPDVEVPDNVLVIVAQNGPWSCADPAKLDEEIGTFKAWSEKTGRRVRTWTYPHKYGALRIGDVPCMAPRAWGTYFRKAAPYVIGGFCETESDRTIYQYLNYYVYSRIAWDPNTDVDALIADHHRAMFGKGAAAMARFYDGMEEAWTRRIAGNVTESAVGPVACVPDEYTIWTDVYSGKVLKEWSACFDEALSAVAGDEASARRIRFIREQFLEPLERRSKAFRESVSVARGLALREKEPNRSILVNGELDTLEGWSGRPGGKMELDARVKCRGSHSVKLVSTDQFALCKQDLAGRLKPDTDYRVSFFMKLEDVTPVGTKGTRGACLELADGGWKFFPPTAAWCGTKDWTFHEYTVRTGKQLSKNPQLLAVLFNAKGTAWFDDIRLEECPQGAAARPVTKALFFFDTEEYTDPSNSDPIVSIANLLAEEGVRGHFAFVGYLAKRIVDWRRMDVIDALKPHLIGTQTLYHSLHPNINEKTDVADYDEAYRRAAADEWQSLGMILAALGREREDVLASVMPGPSHSYVAFYLYADMGIRFFGGCGGLFRDGRHGELWYCNQRHLPYSAEGNDDGIHLETFLRSWDEKWIAERLDKIAKLDRVTFYMHPHMAVCARHPDGLNWDKRNMTSYGKWVSPPHRDPAVTAEFYRRLRKFVRIVKADPRFEITDCERLIREEIPRRTITRAEIPAIRASLERALAPVEAPASWSVADCFQAAVRLLRGETAYVPGKVYGFLEAPRGVTGPVTVRTADLRAAAARIPLGRFLPATVRVGAADLGAADFLFAALEALETGADEVRVVPREQLGDVARLLPGLAGFTTRGKWRYAEDYEDRYLSDRLRLQLWTLRYEI